MSVLFLNKISLCSILQAALRPENFLGASVRTISKLIPFFAATLSPLPAFADPGTTTAPDTKVAKVLSAGAFATVSQLGESDREAARRDEKLLSHHRATDPFGNSVRGPFRGLPPVVEQPAAAPAQPAATAAPTPLNQVATAVNVPTLEKAVQELVIGAINLRSRQILIGSRSIREGDLLVLGSAGGRFIVWVERVDAAGVVFCDTDLQKHILKPFGFGPQELPMDQVWSVSEISKSLNQDARQ
jgi:hypothetical protein